MYPGNKDIPGVIHKIVNQIPASTDFHELYAGSAAVSRFLSVRSTNLRIHLNDIDPLVIRDYGSSYPAAATVTNFKAVDIINTLKTVPAVDSGIFIFLDPPYLHDCRAGNTDIYNHEMTVADHKELLTSVRDLKHNCMIIHPQCDLYDQALKSFRKVHITIRYHKKTSHEYLYMNYPQPQSLLTYDLYGTDCWDRQRVKRKGTRLLKKLSELPVLERKTVLSMIYKFFDYTPIDI